jgi:hypothetical protein
MREPIWLPLRVPLSWTVEVVFEFGDEMYIHVWESHDRFAKLQICRRVQWSYHYGPIVQRDDLGRATQGAADAPLEIRIDTCGGEPHLHYRQREPHHAQERIRGLKIDSVEALAFVKAVLKHRHGKQSFEKIMGFKLA